MYQIYPRVKKQRLLDGESRFGSVIAFFETNYASVFNELSSFFKSTEGKKNESNVILLNKELNDQEYELEVKDNIIKIYANSESGFFYGIKTLEQIFNENMKNIYIQDEPDLKIRGYMMDISRNKVPKIATIKHMVDIMADLKMNHFELYVEGFSFEYQSFSEYLENESYITIDEYKDIEKYCNLRCIDLVPNQNGFGHMAEWLKTDKFKDLAESPDGIDLWGTHRDPTTLNPLDSRSIDLVKQMYQDMLPWSNSKYFNMNFDEPFELGKCRSKDECEKKGLGNVYVDYMLKAYDNIKTYNKTPLIWGDVLLKHDDVLSRIPKDMIFLDWGYDASYPFSKNCLKLKNAGINFMAAPGTTSWCSFFGRTYDFIENISNACYFVKKYDGLGMILTDWGDFGHLQYLNVTYAPLVFGAMLSYRLEEGTYGLLKTYLNKYVFKDKSEIIADLLLDLGNYYRYENNYQGNGTQTFYTMYWAVNALKEKDPIAYFREKTRFIRLSYEKITMLYDFFDLKNKELTLSKVDELTKNEIRSNIFFVKCLLTLNVSMNDSIPLETRIYWLDITINSKERLIEDLRRNWLERNKISGLNKSIIYIEKIIQFANILIDYLRRTE